MTKKKPYRICLIMPENYPHSLCFREIGLLLLSSLQSNGFECDFKINDLAKYRTNIILGYHLMTFNEGLKSYRYIPYQLEQLHSDEYPFSKNQEQILRHGISVWDYSKENIEFLKQKGISATELVPGYHKKLELIPEVKDQDIDILFYGSLGDRRKALLSKLDKEFKIKTLFGVYGKDRDQWISRARIILNIHHYSTQIFESVRISYLLNNSCFVISEQSNYYTYKKINLTFSPYEKIVESCKFYLKSPEKMTGLKKENYKSFKEHYPMQNFLQKVLNNE